MAVSSIEENVEDIAKEWLKKFGVKYYTKTESVNTEIDTALINAPSKKGAQERTFLILNALLIIKDGSFL